ncbi:MAG: SMC family ATPase, partial [Armatimonadetes bacterium]|nr:SMC family ATPase [Armatimonadota bacterium]
MIPVRLLLKNFLSYGSAGETIEFGGIHVACLCGPNGHGKSALLDAITWSLWGKARGSHDDLVRVGQTSMVVELEFELDDQLYRVVRRRTRGRTGQSDLQFQVQKPEGDWHALTGQGVTGTQRLIERTLRMDYDTFVNSAFILQGRADEFARRTPGERKRILSEILNLGLYEQLTEKARELRASAATRVHGCDREIVRLQRERAALEQLEAEVAQLTLHQEAAHDRAELLRAQYEEVSAEAARLEALRDEREERARRSRQLEGELGRDR